ncbi:hypothetical protein roselon_02618 [Roseibacterium elongatum DSM 19469]|uniref:2-oxoglutarate-dependent ethylene/succinate-forming enzyme n=1 Tax=Roseicyclus elongatus DSM 19469 TaxID=1294273 RepID=W8S439_9RHOB|nr:2OG-Fe(II) oxygenase family protein [Roseibacterium elongatum]AHM04932.1 hypothetical protein roselon_02618 [Roseibacterium elongatum DSM 19469]
MIPKVDAAALARGDAQAMDHVRTGAFDTGFLLLENTALGQAAVARVIETYRAFFHLPPALKAKVDMAATGSNRGWGAAQSEQVDPMSNPDYKEFFDCGVTLAQDDPLAQLQFYAPNRWPEAPAGFRDVIEAYFDAACRVALALLSGIARAIGEDGDYFADKFAQPMALLRGNYYPARPGWAGDKDFGIAPHTDYGCLTLLATDGQPGLEVALRDGSWHPVQADPGVFVVNFGEMLEMWSNGRVRATLHRVLGGPEERISVPLFFNPTHDTNVAPIGSGKVILAGDHLSRRYTETYVHLHGQD